MKIAFITIFTVAVLGATSVIFPESVVAQGSQKALTYMPYYPLDDSGNIIIFNYTGAVSWSFTPNADLMVTAISSTAPQVNFWLGTNQVIASYDFTGSPTNFQTIPPLMFSAGQMYSVTTQCSNTTFLTYFLGSGTDVSTFATSPYISQFESYIGLPNSQLGASSSNLFQGPNFQFQVVQPLLNISTSNDGLTLSWITASTNWVLQRNLDLTTTNWVTPTNSPTLNFSNLQNQVTLSLSNNSFFIVWPRHNLANEKVA